MEYVWASGDRTVAVSPALSDAAAAAGRRARTTAVATADQRVSRINGTAGEIFIRRILGSGQLTSLLLLKCSPQQTTYGRNRY
jgi:hypothetical protein